MSTPARKISAVPPPTPAPAVSDETALDLYYWMVLTRATEERALNLYRQGKLPGSYYTGRGQEAISIGMAGAPSPRPGGGLACPLVPRPRPPPLPRRAPMAGVCP